MHVEGIPDTHGGSIHGLVHISSMEGTSDQDICARVLVQQGTVIIYIGQWINGITQGIVVDHDAFSGVFR